MFSDGVKDLHRHTKEKVGICYNLSYQRPFADEVHYPNMVAYVDSRRITWESQCFTFPRRPLAKLQRTTRPPTSSMARTTRAAATASGSTTTKTKEKPKESATSSKTATKGKQSKSKAKAAETEDDDNDDHDDEEETTTTDGIPTLLLPKGQTQTTDALLKKLQALHAYLNSWVQHEDEEAFAEKHDLKSQKSPINIARRHLVDNSILLHKNQGVKAYAACCISDVLRLYAPDAPYREDELRDIFQFFVKQLSIGLRGTSSESTPYFDQYYHLLESLSTVKSVVLICDLPNSEELTTEFFREFFLLAAGGKHGQFQGGVVRARVLGEARLTLLFKVQTNRKLIHYMGDILVAIIDESTSIPGEVTELILAQFMQQVCESDHLVFAHP